jgi:DNA-binding transcriptional LysR family regulator
MDPRNLALDTLRTLVVANDLGTYGQAAKHLGLSPSAISVQMKRLQEDIGVTLFRKDGREKELTEAGEIAVHYGRRMLALNDELLDTVRGASLAGSVRLGFSQDFAEAVLPVVLSQFTKLYPLVLMEVRIEDNAALVEAVEGGQLDLALAVGHADRPTAQLLGELELVWIAGQDFSARSGQPLPLVLLGPQCAFRKKAIEKLDQARIPWRIAAVSPSLAGLWASAIGGLGITARTSLGLPAKLASGKALLSLPPLGSFTVTLHTQSTAMSAGVERLRAIISEVLVQTLRASQTARKLRAPELDFSALRMNHR